MHVLILPSEHYVTERAPLGGVFQHDQAQALRRHGLTVGVVSAGFVPFRWLLRSYRYSQYEDDRGIATYRRYTRTPVPGRLSNRLLWTRVVNSYLEMFATYVKRHGRPNVVHAHNCLHAGVAAMRIRERYGIPYLVTEHSSAYARNLVSDREGERIRAVFRHAGMKTCVSSALGTLLENRFGDDACPQHPILNMLNRRFEEIEGIVGPARPDGRPFTFLTVGSLDTNKNHADLLSAFATAFGTIQPVQLRIAGDGPQRRRLDVQVRALGLQDRLVFTGLLSRDAVLNEMRECDAFVLSSRVETFGVVLIEALACGKPVVATNAGGPADIVTTDNGLLVPVGDVAALARAMQTLHSGIRAYDARRIRAGCLDRFGQGAFVARLRAMYDAVLDGKPRL